MNLEQARYMVAVADFLLGVKLGHDDAPIAGLRLSAVCPECGVQADRNPMSLFGVTHGVIHATGAPTDPWLYTIVVIACEGYKVVNPNRVGIPAANWQPLTD